MGTGGELTRLRRRAEAHLTNACVVVCPTGILWRSGGRRSTVKVYSSPAVAWSALRKVYKNAPLEWLGWTVRPVFLGGSIFPEKHVVR